MSNLVSLVDGIPTTTSQKVAEVFGKTHDKVCRDIRNLLKDEPEWCAANFGETSFDVLQPNGGTRKSTMYTMYAPRHDATCHGVHRAEGSTFQDRVHPSL